MRRGPGDSARTILLAALAAFNFAFGCGGGRKSEKGFDELARAIQNLAIPSTSGVETSGVERTETSARISWEFGISTSWKSYRRWAADRLRFEDHFQITRESPLSLSLSKWLPGDIHRVEIEEVRPGRIRVTLIAYAS